MPTAPQAQRQVMDAPFPNVRVGAAPTSDTYGGQIGDTVSHAAVRMYDLQTRSSDHAAVLEAETQANAEQLRIQQDVLAMKGKNAANAPAYAQEEWGKVHEKIIGSLANDRQKALYHQSGIRNGEIINRGALQHFNQEDAQYQQQTFEANIKSSIDVAKANADSPVAVAFEKDMQAQRINEHAVANGYDGTPRHEQALTTVRSATNKEVIQGLLDKGQDLRAKAYYDSTMKQEKANPGSLQFTANDRDVVDKAIFEGSTRGASRRTAQELIAKHGLETTDQRKAVMTAIDGIKDDKVADLTRQRVAQKFSEFDQFKKEQGEQTFMGASKTIEDRWKQNPNAHIRDMVPVADWNRLTPGEQNTLELKLKRLRSPEQDHDPAVWLKGQLLSKEQLATMSPQTMVKDYLNHFDPKHYDRFIEDVQAARNAQTKGDEKDSTLSPLSLREQIKNGWIDSKIANDPNKLKGDETIWFNRYETEAARALSSLPKNATQAHVDEAINGVKDRLLKQKYSVNPGGIRGFLGMTREVPGVALADEKDLSSVRVPLKDIPADRQDVLKGALRQAGVPITDQAIQELEAKARLKKQGMAK